MAANKTQPTQRDPVAFISGVENSTRRKDAVVLCDLMERVTGCPPMMWGPSMVGFGSYHYRYDSGREGDYFLTGFSPRAANLVVYIVAGYDDLGEPLTRLGKHRLGKSCLYINRLADVDLDVLEEIVTIGVATVRSTHETSGS